MTSFQTAKPVRKGSTLAIVAPAGPFNRERFEAGIAWLRQRYEVCYDDEIFSKAGYFAGPDARRLEELQSAIRRPDVDAILCARGGYGITRLLPSLDPAEIADANKLLIGFSDVTALHAVWARAATRSIHAPMVASLPSAGDHVREEWIRTIEGRDAPETWELEPIVSGTATGRLFGGNLAVLCALLGTPFEPPVSGTILFLEDVGERPYRVDRMLTSLTQAGWFERCTGIVLGAFTDGEPGDDGVSQKDVLVERLGGLGIPVVNGFPAGHIDQNEPITFGTTAEINGANFTIGA